MAITDPLSYEIDRDSGASETRTFTSEWVNKDGTKVLISLTLTCRALDTADGFVAIEQGNNYARKYVAPEGEIPSALIDLGGKPIAMSGELCSSVANILVAQVGAERYDFEALCRYSVLLGASKWAEVMVWCGTLSKQGSGQGKP